MTDRSIVYFVRMGPYVKIGTTANLTGRMMQLCLPMRAVAATMPGGADVERDLHELFADARISGSEWFAVTPELEEFLASIGATAPRLNWKKPDPASHPEVPVRLLHDIAETAVLLGATEGDVWRLIHEGRLPLRRIGSRTPRVRRVDIEQLAERQEGPW